MCKAQIFARKNMFMRHDIYSFKSGIWIVVMATWLFENNPLLVCRNSHDSYRSLYMDPSCFVRTGGQLPPAQTVIVVIFFDENVNYHRKTKKYKVIRQLRSDVSVCLEIIGIKTNTFDPWIISKEAPFLILDLRIKNLLS